MEQVEERLIMAVKLINSKAVIDKMSFPDFCILNKNSRILTMLLKERTNKDLIYLLDKFDHILDNVEFMYDKYSHLVSDDVHSKVTAMFIKINEPDNNTETH
jgi:hypothetical protein